MNTTEIRKALTVDDSEIHPDRVKFCLSLLRQQPRKTNILELGFQNVPQTLKRFQKRVYLVDLDKHRCDLARKAGFSHVFCCSWTDSSLFKQLRQIKGRWVVYDNGYGTAQEIKDKSKLIRTLRPKFILPLVSPMSFNSKKLKAGESRVIQVRQFLRYHFKGFSLIKPKKNEQFVKRTSQRTFFSFSNPKTRVPIWLAILKR